MCTHNIPCRRRMVVVIVVVYLSTEMFVYVYQAPSKKQELLCEKPRQLYQEAICRSETRSCLSTVGPRLLILSAKVLKRLQSSPEAGRPPSLRVVVKIVLLPRHLPVTACSSSRLPWLTRHTALHHYNINIILSSKVIKRVTFVCPSLKAFSRIFVRTSKVWDETLNHRILFLYKVVCMSVVENA